MEKIKLLIVDDHQMVRLGLSSFMNIQPDIEVVGEAADGESGFLKTDGHSLDYSTSRRFPQGLFAT